MTTSFTVTCNKCGEAAEFVNKERFAKEFIEISYTEDKDYEVDSIYICCTKCDNEVEWRR